MEGELKFGLSLSTIWETFSDIFWMVLIRVAMVRAERSEKIRLLLMVFIPALMYSTTLALTSFTSSEKVAESRDMVLEI